MYGTGQFIKLNVLHSFQERCALLPTRMLHELAQRPLFEAMRIVSYCELDIVKSRCNNNKGSTMSPGVSLLYPSSCLQHLFPLASIVGMSCHSLLCSGFIRALATSPASLSIGLALDGGGLEMSISSFVKLPFFPFPLLPFLFHWFEETPSLSHS